MEKKIIDYSISFQQIDDFFDKYNQGKSQGDPSRLKQSCKSVAKEVIRLYGKQLYKDNMMLIKGEVYTELYDNIPPLLTNNKTIARKIEVSDRCVRTQIAKLRSEKVGLFIGKVNHGSKKNFEIWINPKILMVTSKTLQEVVDLKKKNTDYKKNKRKNFPPKSDSSNIKTSFNNNNNNTSVEKNKELPGGNDFLDSGTESQQKLLATSKSEYPMEVKKEIKEKKLLGAAEKIEKTTSLDEKKKKHVEYFWKLAKSLLYSDIKLLEHEIVVAKTHIKKYYEDAKNEETLERWHNNFSKMLVMAANYYQKHPGFDKYNPSYYFDLKNDKTGFIVTKRWLIKQHQDKIILKKRSILNSVIKKINKSPNNVTVYKDCEKIILKFKDKKLTDLFYQKSLENQMFFSNY